MTTFRTIVNIPPQAPNERINYDTPLLLMGSCFAENIGGNLLYYKLPTCLNPFGILYNPLSVQAALQSLIIGKKYAANDLLFYNEQWLSLAHHGRFSHSDKAVCLQQINEAVVQGQQYLLKARFLVITFGTAWAYRQLVSQQVVANCHKIPAREFERFRISKEEIVATFKQTIHEIRTFNTDLRVVFTVSPVRHWKDGAVENQWSKATLLTAVHELCTTMNKVYYFPAYEMMMDDLRDYRFYKSDMMHPNEVAVDYIWQRFGEAFFTEKTQDILQKISKIQQARHHRPRNPKSDAHQRFLQKQLQQIEQLERQFPMVNFEEEKGYFTQNINLT